MNSKQFYRQPADPPPRSVSTRDAARMLSVSVSTIERLTRSGELASVKIGSCRRYRVETIEAFLRRHETVAGGQA